MKRIASVVLMALVLAGCATPTPTGRWWTLRESNFRDLRPGLTTKDEVLKNLGTPFAATSFARLQEEVWDYQYADAAIIMHAAVHFDVRSVFKYYWVERSPAHYSGYGS
jgi:outer membrane protein assembly factor BamE (lipoprotein component of BamABCDE complex)